MRDKKRFSLLEGVIYTETSRVSVSSFPGPISARPKPNKRLLFPVSERARAAGKALLLGTLISVAAVLCSEAAVGNCNEESRDRAAALFEQARTVSGAQQRLKLYEQSVQACPRFASLYTLGRTQLELNQPTQALQTFKQAEDLAESGYYRGLLTARVAEAHLAMENLPAAVAAVESAVEMIGAEDLPQWFLALRREIDGHPRRDLVSAAELGETVRAMRAFGVSPRIDVRVLFDYDSDRINDTGRRQVEALGRALRDQLGEGERVLIIGHTDRHGGEDYNQDLSKRRASRVIAELTQYYPELTGRLQGEGRGKSQLKYSGLTRDDDRLNRRVEVRVSSR